MSEDFAKMKVAAVRVWVLSSTKEPALCLSERAARKRKYAHRFSYSPGNGGIGPGGVNIETRKAPGRDELDDQRIRELGINHEQGNVTDLREGVGGVRYEQTTGHSLRASNTEGVDFYDGETPISLKGPLARKDTGELLAINDSMFDGLADSVVKGAQTNTAARNIVVDTLGLSDTQRSRLTERISQGLADFDAMPTNVIILE